MLSKEEVLKIAKLARLELTDEEVIKMQKDLSAILEYFNLLKKIDTSGVKLGGGENLLLEKATRKDVVLQQNVDVVDKLIQSAPDKKDNYVKVKAIL